MSKTTTNYKLIKPELTDVADITAMNENWDKIDKELMSLNEPEWVTLGTLTHSATAFSSPGTGSSGTGTVTLSIPCDNEVIDEFNHFRIVLKNGSVFKASHQTTSSTAATITVRIEDASRSLLTMECGDYATVDYHHSLEEDIWNDVSCTKGYKLIVKDADQSKNTVSTSYDELKSISLYVSLSSANSNAVMSMDCTFTIELQGMR